MTTVGKVKLFPVIIGTLMAAGLNAAIFYMSGFLSGLFAMLAVFIMWIAMYTLTRRIAATAYQIGHTEGRLGQPLKGMTFNS